MITFLLSLYASVVASFLFGRFLFLLWKREKVRRLIKENRLPLVRDGFISAHPPQASPQQDAIKDIGKMIEEEEVGGRVITVLERELESEDSQEIEPSVEEREFEEEQRLLRKFGR